MTEQQWMECAEPERMLYLLRGKATDRKVRLFAVATCRHVWHFMKDERSRTAVEISEAYADGSVDRQALQRACKVAILAENEASQAFFVEGPKIWNECPARQAAVLTARDPIVAFQAASQASRAGVWALGGELEDMQAAKAAEDTYQCAIVRDVFGNPFCPVAFDRSWRTPDSVTLAGHIYHDRAFGRMLELAEVLEDSGCDDAYLVGHLRGPGPHARGCHVVDALLGKS